MAGRKTRAPKCSTVLVVPALLEETAQDVSPEPLPELYSQNDAPEGEPNSLIAPGPPESDFDFDVGSRLRPRRLATAAVSNTVVIQNSSGAAHSLGIASLVIGVLSFCLCWIPFLGLLISGLGLLLGLGGFILALQRGGSGIGFSIGGGALSALSLVVCILWSAGVTNAFMAANKILANQNHTNQDPVSNLTGQDGASAKNGDTSTPMKPEIKWFDASKGAVQQGNIRVRIVSVSVGKVPLKDFFGQDTWSEVTCSCSKCRWIRLVISALSFPPITSAVREC